MASNGRRGATVGGSVWVKPGVVVRVGYARDPVSGEGLLNTCASTSAFSAGTSEIPRASSQTGLVGGGVAFAYGVGTKQLNTGNGNVKIARALIGRADRFDGGVGGEGGT